MVDAEAALAAAQKLADQYTSQAAGAQGSFQGSENAENGDLGGQKRKFEDDAEDEAAIRKRTSFNDPHDGGQGTDPLAHGGTEGLVTFPDTKVEDKPSSSGPFVGPTGEMTDTVDIAASMVGKLIGKAGETIRHLQNSTGTRVQIDHHAPGEKKTVTITGSSAEAVTAAKQQVESLTSDEPSAGEQQKSMECPQGIVGRIIGRGGETIRALQQASMAHIVVDQNFPEGHPRKVNISGRPEAVERASKMIDELINGEPGSAQAIIQKYGAGISNSLECPKGIVGRVIGKGGETIKALQKNFGCNIQIDQAVDPMKITIKGQHQAVEAAAAAVQEIIAGGNPFLGGPGGAPGGQYGGYGGAAGGGGGFGAPGGYGFGGYGGYPGGGFPQAAYGGYPGGFPQPYAQPGYGGYGSYGQDPYGAGGGGGGGGAYGGFRYMPYNSPTTSSPEHAGGGGASGSGNLWQELQDDQGRSYYYNTQTGVSQWEKPEGFTG